MKRLPARIRLRRRLLVTSALPSLIAVAIAVKLISVVVVGNSAQEHYGAGDIGGLRDDVSLLRVLNVIEPANTASAAGGLAVLQDRLEEADAQFTDALTRTGADRSCPVRVNLALVRERRGDIDAWEARLELARQRYESALAVIGEAPGGCFDGNTDPDPARRAVREDADERITAKIGALGSVAPLAPPPPPIEVPAAPSAPPVSAPDASDPAEARRLDPGSDPLEALRRLLHDAAAG